MRPPPRPPRATGGEVRPVERSDEQPLESAGALHPQALQIEMTISQPRQRGRRVQREGRARREQGEERCRCTRPAMGDRRPFMAFLRACRRSRRRPCARPPASPSRRSRCSIRLSRKNASRNLVAELPNLSDRLLQPSRIRPFGFDVSMIHCVVLPSGPGTARVIQP
jgi:hypothetical protein